MPYSESIKQSNRQFYLPEYHKDTISNRHPNHCSQAVTTPRCNPHRPPTTSPCSHPQQVSPPDNGPRLRRICISFASPFRTNPTSSQTTSRVGPRMSRPLAPHLLHSHLAHTTNVLLRLKGQRAAPSTTSNPQVSCHSDV